MIELELFQKNSILGNWWFQQPICISRKYLSLAVAPNKKTSVNTSFSYCYLKKKIKSYFRIYWISKTSSHLSLIFSCLEYMQCTPFLYYRIQIERGIKINSFPWIFAQFELDVTSQMNVMTSAIIFGSIIVSISKKNYLILLQKKFCSVIVDT